MDSKDAKENLNLEERMWESVATRALSEIELKFLTHTATIDEWIYAVEGHLRTLEDSLAQTQAADEKTGKRDVVLLDVVLAMENERALYELEGHSRVYGKGKALEDAPANLNAKRYTCIDELAERLKSLHANPEALNNSVSHYERPLLTTAYTEEIPPHFIALEMWTQNLEGIPKTVILGLESTHDSKAMATWLSSELGKHDISNTDIVIYPAATQTAPADCLLFSAFHILKFRSLEKKGTFHTIIRDLMQGRIPEGSTKISEGSLNTYSIDRRSKAGQIVPPEIIKEMQSRQRLISTINDRQWPVTVTAKHNTVPIIDRYDDNHEGYPWSASMAKKRIKYFKRVLIFLQKIKAGRTDQEALTLLNELLANARNVVTKNSSQVQGDYSELIERGRLENREISLLSNLKSAAEAIEYFEDNNIKFGDESPARMKQNVQESIIAFHEITINATSEIGVPWNPADPKIEQRNEWQENQLKSMKENFQTLAFKVALGQQHTRLQELHALQSANKAGEPHLSNIETALKNIESRMEKIEVGKGLDEQTYLSMQQVLNDNYREIATCTLAAEMADRQFSIYNDCNQLLANADQIKKNLQQLAPTESTRTILEQISSIEPILKLVRYLPKIATQTGVPWQLGEADKQVKDRQQWYNNQLNHVKNRLPNLAQDLTKMSQQITIALEQKNEEEKKRRAILHERDDLSQELNEVKQELTSVKAKLEEADRERDIDTAVERQLDQLISDRATAQQTTKAKLLERLYAGKSLDRVSKPMPNQRRNKQPSEATEQENLIANASALPSTEHVEFVDALPQGLNNTSLIDYHDDPSSRKQLPIKHGSGFHFKLRAITKSGQTSADKAILGLAQDQYPNHPLKMLSNGEITNLRIAPCGDFKHSGVLVSEAKDPDTQTDILLVLTKSEYDKRRKGKGLSFHQLIGLAKVSGTANINISALTEKQNLSKHVKNKDAKRSRS